jgi:hypothetical protein
MMRAILARGRKSQAASVNDTPNLFRISRGRAVGWLDE